VLYHQQLSRLLNVPLGDVGELLLYTHYDWGTSYVLGYNQRRKNTKLLIIRAETLCQIGIHSMLDQSVCGCE